MNLPRTIVALLVALGLAAALSRSTPGVPRLAPQVIDQTRPDLGLSRIEAEHVLLHEASDDEDKYTHHAHLAVFRDELYAMWSSGPVDEDSPAQRVVIRRSADGLSWTPSRTLAPDPDGPDGPQRRTAGGFWSDAHALVAFFSTFGEAAQEKWASDMRLEMMVSRDGREWSAPRVIVRDFLINEPPRRAGALWLMTGEDHRGTPRILWSSRSPLEGVWHDARLDAMSWSDGNRADPGRRIASPLVHGDAAPITRMPPNEPTWYCRPDGLVALFRDDNRSRRLLACMSHDGGRTWGTIVPSGLPDATAKARAQGLPDGRIALIGNPSEQFGRSPLAILLSRDGLTFDRAFALRDDAPRERFPGRYKGPGFQYPGSVVWREHLYVIYSISKEDIAVSRVRLRDLAP